MCGRWKGEGGEKRCYTCELGTHLFYRRPTFAGSINLEVYARNDHLPTTMTIIAIYLPNNSLQTQVPGKRTSQCQID